MVGENYLRCCPQVLRQLLSKDKFMLLLRFSFEIQMGRNSPYVYSPEEDVFRGNNVEDEILGLRLSQVSGNGNDDEQEG